MRTALCKGARFESKPGYGLKADIPYLTNMGIETACTYFQLNKTELKCYTKKQSTKEHWI